MSAYLDLPPNSAVETPFTLPALTTEFAPELPPAQENRDDDEEFEAADVMASSNIVEAPVEDAEQLSFL